MTVDTDRSGSPSVFDAGLPTIAYEDGQNPDDAHRLIRQARQQAPIAVGPHGPQVLTYDLVRTVLRDPRFRMPHGLGLKAQGITSGPLWDRVIKPCCVSAHPARARSRGTRHHLRSPVGQGH